MEQDKIFVVVPVYKVELYLHRCIDSIINQTLSDFQLILVDDGSPDNCGAVCDEYAARDARIHVIHQENGGLSAARNAGIAYAMAHADPERDWISFIDSDDFVHPCYLQYLYRAAKEAGVEISCCRFVRTSKVPLDLSLDTAFMYSCITPEEYWSRFGNNSVMAVAKLYRLHLFAGITYPIGKVHEDTFTTWKLMFQCSKIASSEACLYYYYINPKSITASAWTPSRMDVLAALEEQLIFFNNHGYPKARKPIVEFMFWSSIKQHMLIRGLSPKYNSYIKEIRKWQKHAFILFIKEFGVRRTISYWLNVRIISPAKRVLKAESIYSFIKKRIKKSLHIR